MSGKDLRLNEINAQTWSLFDKVMYGGLGYGSFCLPTNLLKVIITIVFPPLGEVMNIIGNDVSYDYPFINWKVFHNLIQFENINRIIYSFILTTLFYIPGLIYTLGNISDNDNKNKSY